jgi:hypothetical protein
MEMEDTVVEGVEVAEDIVQGVVAEGAAAEGEADQIYECVNSIDFFFKTRRFFCTYLGNVVCRFDYIGKDLLLPLYQFLVRLTSFHFYSSAI